MKCYQHVTEWKQKGRVLQWIRMFPSTWDPRNLHNPKHVNQFCSQGNCGGELLICSDGYMQTKHNYIHSAWHALSVSTSRATWAARISDGPEESGRAAVSLL